MFHKNFRLPIFMHLNVFCVLNKIWLHSKRYILFMCLGFSNIFFFFASVASELFYRLSETLYFVVPCRKLVSISIWGEIFNIRHSCFALSRIFFQLTRSRFLLSGYVPNFMHKNTYYDNLLSLNLFMRTYISWKGVCFSTTSVIVKFPLLFYNINVENNY